MVSAAWVTRGLSSWVCCVASRGEKGRGDTMLERVMDRFKKPLMDLLGAVCGVADGFCAATAHRHAKHTLERAFACLHQTKAASHAKDGHWISNGHTLLLLVLRVLCQAHMHERPGFVRAATLCSLPGHSPWPTLGHSESELSFSQ